MWKLTRFLKGYMTITVLGPVLKLAEAIFELITPLVVASIIDKGIDAGNTGYIYKMGIVLILLCLAGFAFSMTCQYFAARSAMGFGTNLRKHLYLHINKLSYSDLDALGIPSLVTRLTADVNQTQLAVNRFIRLVTRSPFIVIGSIVMAMIIDAKLSLVFLGASLLVGAALYWIMSRTVPYYQKVQKQLDHVSLLTRENLTGTRVVRAFSRQAEEVEDFSRSAEALAHTSKGVARIAALMNPVSYTVINVAIMLILYFGGITVQHGNLTQGQVIALVNYLNQILLSILVLANLIVIFTKASASARRINEVFAVAPSVLYPHAETNKEQDGILAEAPAVEFRSVSFSYQQNVNNSIEDISFTLDRGCTLGVIGRTGSGKTTLINLLQRFYDADQGEIRLNGIAIDRYSNSALRKMIGLVPQKSVLFSGTLRENMQWGDPEATEEEIAAALAIAQAEEFVAKLPDGYDTKVLKGGKNFSGGQRQRLCIARALVGKKEIIVLDDSSAALDYATEAKLRRALRRSLSHCAVILISQRATALKHCDKILVLEEGRAAGLGTHRELMERCAEYQDIYNSQTKEAAHE